MKRSLKILLILLLVIAAVSGWAAWFSLHYVVVDFSAYPKDQRQLDLRQKELSIEAFEKLQKKLPDCEIAWNVPVQGALYPNDTEELTLTELSEEAVEALDHLPRLKRVDVRESLDYANIAALQQRRPEVEVLYTVRLDGKAYRQEEDRISLTRIREEEISRLAYLPNLTSVTFCGEDQPHIDTLRDYCRDNGCAFAITLGGAEISADARAVTVEGISGEEVKLLAYLDNMKTLHLQQPEAAVEDLIAWKEENPQVNLTWTRTVCGKSFESDAEEIDISGVAVEDLEQVAEEMRYFPNAKLLNMSHCGIDNVLMAAFRETQREFYKVVWTVSMGKYISYRTDTTSIMPARDGTSNFHDADAYNMRYCEDVVAVDVGHLDIRTIEWVEFMPNLKYLILAHTGVRDITPISSCKNLLFLELDHSPVGDFTPLQGCTALEDLNIGMTYASEEPLYEMTWLKNVWCIFRPGVAYRLKQVLPNTFVQATGDATVASGWRRLDNYFDMRDALGMFYMDW